MRKVKSLEADAVTGFESQAGGLSLVSFSHYASDTPIVKGRQQLRQNMISLLTEGEKLIFVDGQILHVEPKNILVLAAGNYLYTERFAGAEGLKSILIFFDSEVLDQMPRRDMDNDRNKGCAPFIVIPKDNYLRNYIGSLQSLLGDDAAFSQDLRLVKLQELLLYLCNKHPALLGSFQSAQPDTTDEQNVRKIVQENLMNNLSLAELAFLCNMSLPTFKRKFALVYNASPAKWIQEQKMRIAADLLSRKKARPADVYMRIGYENHSSFSQAFKSCYGVVPKDYTGQALLKKTELSATGK